jgi:putative ABC transport system permease protein
MMTGQILSGVSPLIAARYQIMVMCMVFGAAGISSACFLVMSKQIFVGAGKREKVTANNETDRVSAWFVNNGS